jgi:hypothetical protein
MDFVTAQLCYSQYTQFTTPSVDFTSDKSKEQSSGPFTRKDWSLNYIFEVLKPFGRQVPIEIKISGARHQNKNEPDVNGIYRLSSYSRFDEWILRRHSPSSIDGHGMPRYKHESFPQYRILWYAEKNNPKNGCWMLDDAEGPWLYKIRRISDFESKREEYPFPVSSELIQVWNENVRKCWLFKMSKSYRNLPVGAL